MPEHKPTDGKKLAAKIRRAVDLIERAHANRLTERSERQRAGYGTDRAVKAQERGEKQEAEGRPMLAEALAELEASLVVGEEAAIAGEDAVILKVCEILLAKNIVGGIEAEQLAATVHDWQAEQAAKRRRR